MTTKRKTTRTSKTTKTAKYNRLSEKQLAAVVRKWHKRHASLAKTPAWKTTQGWTPQQQRACLSRELKVVAAVLRGKILQRIDDVIHDIKRQEAKRLGVSVNSPVVNTAVVKRLKAKRTQICNSKAYPVLATVCSNIKWSSFKPSSRRALTKTTRTYGKTKAGGKYIRTTTTTAVNAKYTKHTKSLKKEIQRLKQRNSFMRSQVAKFRKEVSKLQRHYGTISNISPRYVSPSLRLVKNKVGQDVSNIVRFSNALNNAITKQRFAG